MTSFRYKGVYHKPKGSFYMEYELKHYYRVKYAFVCARQSFLKDPPKDDYEEYAKKIINRTAQMSNFWGITARILTNIKSYDMIC